MIEARGLMAAPKEVRRDGGGGEEWKCHVVVERFAGMYMCTGLAMVIGNYEKKEGGRKISRKERKKRRRRREKRRMNLTEKQTKR